MERIYHRWEKWEDYPAGFFENHPPKGLTPDQCQQMYAEFLRDLKRFKKAAYRVIMNRIAWMGQAAMCIETGVPAQYRGGYHLLTLEEQKAADLTALDVINYWMFLYGEAQYTLETISSRTKANLY